MINFQTDKYKLTCAELSRSIPRERHAFFSFFSSPICRNTDVVDARVAVLCHDTDCCCCYCCCRVASVMPDSVRPHRQQPTRLSRPWDSPGKNTGVGCHFLLQWVKVKSESEVAQSCPTLRDPMNCSPPGSSVHGILQARVLERGAIAFSAMT